MDKFGADYHLLYPRVIYYLLVFPSIKLPFLAHKLKSGISRSEMSSTPLPSWQLPSNWIWQKSNGTRVFCLLAAGSSHAGLMEPLLLTLQEKGASLWLQASTWFTLHAASKGIGELFQPGKTKSHGLTFVLSLHESRRWLWRESCLSWRKGGWATNSCSSTSKGDRRALCELILLETSTARHQVGFHSGACSSIDWPLINVPQIPEIRQVNRKNEGHDLQIGLLKVT